MLKENKNVVVLGASDKQDRYSYKALKLLKEHGYTVMPVHPVLDQIEGTPVYKNLSEISAEIDTITLYVNPEILKKHVDQIIRIHPRRVIFNPGTESEAIEKQLLELGINPLRACTLVMLRTGQF